jgi:hypothetical protein
VLPASDYSVQLADDQAGPADAATGLDVNLSDSDMPTATGRLITAVDTGDPRTAHIREFYGTTDGYTVTGRYFNGSAWEWGTSDDSHLWHVHISFHRRWADDPDAGRDIAAIINGEDEMPLNDQDATVVWNHNIRLWNDSTPDAYFVLSAIHQYLQTDRLRAVNWDAIIDLPNGSHPTAESVLSNLHETVHRIDDRLAALEQQLGAQRDTS